MMDQTKQLRWRFLAICVVVIGCIVSLILYQNRREIWPVEDQIKSVVGLAGSRCSVEQVLLVSVKNNSSDTLNQYDLTITANRRGYSTQIANETIRSDKIMPPGASEDLCIRRPGWEMEDDSALVSLDRYRNISPSEIEYSAKVTWVDIQ